MVFWLIGYYVQSPHNPRIDWLTCTYAGGLRIIFIMNRLVLYINQLLQTNQSFQAIFIVLLFLVNGYNHVINFYGQSLNNGFKLILCLIKRFHTETFFTKYIYLYIYIRLQWPYHNADKYSRTLISVKSLQASLFCNEQLIKIISIFI